MNVLDFYIPLHRQEYGEWWKKRFSDGRWRKMNKKQLRAIYIRVRKTEGR